MTTEEKLIQLLTEPRTMAELTRELGVTRQRVYQLFKALPIKKVERVATYTLDK